MKKGSILFTGSSGRQYSFMVWSLDTRFKPMGGVYFVTERRVIKGAHLRPRHNPIFIGQTDNLASTFNDSKLPERYFEFGANCLCVHLHDDAAQRADIEKDLLGAYSTDCNPSRPL